MIAAGHNRLALACMMIAFIVGMTSSVASATKANEGPIGDPSTAGSSNSTDESSTADTADTPAVGPDSSSEASLRWYLAPVVASEPPDAEGAETPVGNPIDRFLLARMRSAGLDPVGDAQRRILIRRITYDLTGLPPTPEEVAAFLADTEPGAWDRVIDRLLNAPEYGERWGRHWLDVVRYADTTGDGTDMPIPDAWRYRDYVIQAFQEDLPYDQFIQEQLAGDILLQEQERHGETPTRVRERRIATGFVALSRRFGNGTYSDMNLVIDNTIETVGQAFLAQGVQCARCHDHKFDPITSADYFGWYGYFESTQYPHGGSEHGKDRLWMVSLAEDPKQYATHFERETRKHFLRARISDIEYDHGDEDKLAKAVRKTKEARVKAEANARAADKQNGTAPGDPWALPRVSGVGGTTPFSNLSDAQLTVALPAIEDHQRAVALHTELVESKAEYALLVRECDKEEELAWSVTDRIDHTGDARIHKAGNPKKTGDRVPRGFLSMLDSDAPEIEPRRSGRLDLAQWIASETNPLTARVMVNRIWQLHFGAGLVDTPNLFGAQGSHPSHPKLLDWLAIRFVESGWSIKAIHRLILQSDAYRRAPSADPHLVQEDPANRLLARFSGKRAEGEVIRDTMLAVSGRLDRTRGGAHPFPKVSKLRFTQHRPFQADYAHERRSVYLMNRRLGQDPILGLFDPPNRNQSQGMRRRSTVPQQALFSMNSEFVNQCAHAFADRISTAADDDSGRLAAAVSIAYQRDIEGGESEAFTEHLAKLRDLCGEDGAWVAIARAVLMSNELIYVD